MWIEPPIRSLMSRLSRAEELHDQTFGGTTFQTQATEVIKVRHEDFIQYDMRNVGIVPDTVRRHRAPSHDHTVRAVVDVLIAANQCALVVLVIWNSID